MDIKFSKKKYTRSIAGKIIFTCLLAFAAISLSLYISKVTFSKILSTVDQLAKPDTKIQLVNDLFRDVVKLDQLQRNQALKTTPTQYSPFLKESRHVQAMLDSLRYMSLQNPTQVARIDAMKKILYKRDLLFLRYIKLRTQLVKNDTLASQVKNLSALIENARTRMDSNLVTTSRATKTIIDTVKQEEGKQSLWSRVFTKRKPTQSQVKKQIQEELHVRVDTFAINNNADSLTKIGEAISKVEMNRLERHTQLTKRHAELNQAGDLLIAQLMSILNDIDNDELQHDMRQNTLANSLVNKSIININAVLAVFILGMVILIILIFTDISKSNQYRKQLVIAKDEAEEAGLVKQRFLANMSHELRTPLQTIIGISEQIRTVSKPQRRDMENIYQSSLHLLQIVNEVLDYSRITSGKYVLENKPFNMYSLLDEVKEMIQVQLLMKNLSFHFHSGIDKNDCYSGDSFRLKQVLLNLLGNAVKFTDEGSVTLSVNGKILPGETTSFTFTIHDTGVGISAEDQAVIFNQFEQGSNLHKKQGTGLGLSIVKAIIDMQHGTVAVESEPGKGTTFTITIPFAKTEAIAVSAPVIPALAKAYNGHVWVVDDDMFILQLCDTILTKYAVPHTCFSSAQQALAAPFPPELDIVFLDIRMAEMDGITLCGRLKEKNAAPVPKYIALTAQAMPYEREAILQQGLDGLVMKPFLEQDFMNVVNEHAAIHQQHPVRPSLDLSAIYKMTGDDEYMMDIVLQSFVTETEKDMAAANAGIREKDSYGLAEALHKLACRYGQLGVTPLAHKLRTMEIALRGQEDIHEVIDTMNTVQDELNDVVALINELLARRMFLQSVEKYNTPASYT